MSYFLVDGSVFIRDFATIGGLERLTKWSRSQDPVIKNFFDSGTTLEPKQLAAKLRLSKPINDPIALEMIDQLIETANTARIALTISDGTSTEEDDEVSALIGNGNNQYRHDAVGKSSAATQKAALTKLTAMPAISRSDPNFKATPFKQVSDTKAEQLEFMDVTHAEAQLYDPSKHESDLRSTQDYVEADKVADLIKQGNTDVAPTKQQIAKVMRGQNTDAVVILRNGGKDYIMDGHHRMTAALLTKSKLHVVLTKGR